MSIFLSVFETDPSRFFEPHPIRITDFPSYVEAFISGTLKSHKKLWCRPFLEKLSYITGMAKVRTAKLFLQPLSLR
jgi:hypothetical protein